MISVLVRISRHNVRRRRSPQFEAPASSVPGNWQTFASGGIGHTSLPLDRQPLGPRRGCVAWVPTCSYADLLSASLFPSYRCTIGGWPTPELRVVAIVRSNCHVVRASQASLSSPSRPSRPPICPCRVSCRSRYSRASTCVWPRLAGLRQTCSPSTFGPAFPRHK